MASKAINRKIKKRKRKFRLFIFFALVAACVYIMYNSDYFKIDKITVSGNNKIEEEKIILASGINTGMNIFEIKKNAVTENIKTHPWIKDVKITRNLPDEIQIEVIEREEEYVVQATGSYIYIDSEGVILSILGQKKEDDVIQLCNFSIDNVSIGNNIDLGEDVTMKQFMKFIDLTKNYNIYNDIILINNNEGKIEIALKDKRVIILGKLKDIDYKVVALDKILEDLKSKGIEGGTIDFTKGKYPVFTEQIGG